MMIRPVDLAKVLTAAAPIVASIAAIANKSESIDKNEKEREKPISVTINNTFYTNSQRDAEMVAEKINEQLTKGVYYSDIRYKL